jgi:hypothetical protein
MKKSVFAALSLLVCCAFLMTPSAAMAGTRPQLNAQQGAGQGDGAGRDVVLSDLPDLSAADLAAAKPEAESPRNPNFTAAGYEAAKLAAVNNSVGTRPQDGARFFAPPSDPRTDFSRNTPGNFVNFLGASRLQWPRLGSIGYGLSR